MHLQMYHQESENTTPKMREDTVMDSIHKGFLSRICKEILQLNDKNIANSGEQDGRGVGRCGIHLSP